MSIDTFSQKAAQAEVLMTTMSGDDFAQWGAELQHDYRMMLEGLLADLGEIGDAFMHRQG